MSIYLEISDEVKKHNATLILVTKTKSPEIINEFYDLGHRNFGENKVQELVPKHELLPKDIRWHFIGHLQKNKVKYIAPFVNLIHSVDSLELLEEINERASKNNRIIDVLLEIKIAAEYTKFGLTEADCISILQIPDIKNLENIRFRGLMGMASFTESTEIVTQEFQKLKTFFDKVRSDFIFNPDDFNVLSMGMSGDYKIALKEGSTMVRIGSLILGER